MNYFFYENSSLKWKILVHVYKAELFNDMTDS